MDFEQLLEKIRNNDISEIEYARAKLTKQNIQDLSDALKTNTSAYIFTLENNPSAKTADAIIEDIDLLPIFKALENHPTISKIIMQYNKIGDEGAKYIADLLSKNGLIDNFTLSNNKIGAKGAADIAKALDLSQGSKCNLSQLHLNDNPLGEGVIYIAAGLVKNNKITSVHLGTTDIDDIGIQAIALMLEQDTNKINSLNLYGNKITDEGVKYLIHALKTKVILSAISIENNYDISSENLQKIDEILAMSSQERQDLRNLTIGDQVLDPVINPIADILKQINQQNNDVPASGEQSEGTGDSSSGSLS